MKQMRTQHWRTPRASFFILLTSTFIVIFCSGCNLLGAGAQLLPAATIQPKYTGLAGQQVAVMVWADRGIRTDFPALSVNLTSMIQSGLKQNLKEKVLEKAQFPYSPQSIVRFQTDHPELETSPIVNVAPHMGVVTRLIYIEVEDFSTQSRMATNLVRGEMTATMRVVEVANGKAKVAYEENNVHAVFPPKSPQEGVVNMEPMVAYRGLLGEFTTEVLHRLVPYQEEEK
jgi:hypothetical protein